MFVPFLYCSKGSSTPVNPCNSGANLTILCLLPENTCPYWVVLKVLYLLTTSKGAGFHVEFCATTEY
ncbi:hypothetical protein D3C87_1536700 [compost metagenome]